MFRTSLFEVGGASRRDTATRHDRGVAFRQPDETLDEAVAAMFERARRNENSAPRKHHVVPASYLARWQRDGQIRVTETDAKRFVANDDWPALTPPRRSFRSRRPATSHLSSGPSSSVTSSSEPTAADGDALLGDTAKPCSAAG